MDIRPESLPADFISSLSWNNERIRAMALYCSDGRWGEAVHAIVVLKPDRAATGEELIVYCHDRIAGYKCPKEIDFAEALPKSGAGKILKTVLRQPFWEGHDRQVA